MRARSGNFNVQAGAARTGHGGRKGVTVNIVLFIASDIPSAGAKLDHIINITSRQSCLAASLGEDSCLFVSKLVSAIDEDLYIIEMSLATSGVLRICSRVFGICSRVFRICSRVFRISSRVFRISSRVYSYILWN